MKNQISIIDPACYSSSIEISTSLNHNAEKSSHSNNLVRRSTIIAMLTGALLLNGCGSSDRIVGDVKDIFGTPLGDVSVTVEKSGFQAKTRSDGGFNLDYAPGQFVVKFAKPGFTTHLLELNLHQKAKYPTGEVVLYPIPSQKGVFYVDREKKQLIELPTNNVVGIKQRGTGFMESIDTFFIYSKSDPRSPVVSPTFRAGEAQFIDTDPSLLKLNQVREKDYVINEAQRNPMGARIIYLDEPPESSSSVGAEKVMIRAFKLSPGVYSWVQHGHTMTGQEVPMKGSATRLFLVSGSDKASSLPVPTDSATYGRKDASIADEQSKARENGCDNNTLGAQATVPTSSQPVAGTSTTQVKTDAKTTTVNTDLYTAEISSQGGDLVRLELKKLRDRADERKPLALFYAAEKHFFLGQSGFIGQGMPNHKSMWQLPTGNHVLKDGENELRLRLEPSTYNGAKLSKTYIFRRGSYEIEVLQEGAQGTHTYLQITRDGEPTTGCQGAMKGVAGFTGAAAYSEYSKFQKVAFADIENGKAVQKYSPKSSDGWLAWVQPNFVTALLVPDKLNRENFMRTSDNKYSIGVIISTGADGKSSVKLYAGPRQNKLGNIAPGLDQVAE